MIKKEWQDLYDILKSIYDNFRIEYRKMEYGKNQPIRKKAERNVGNDINLAAHWIKTNPEAFELLTGENIEDFDRGTIWNEFLLPHYFNIDMPKYLDKMEKKINGF